MNKSFMGAAAGIAIAFALVLVGWILATVIKIPTHLSGDAATWMGALGTFLAFAGTIAIFLHERFVKRHEQNLIAQLVASGMSQRLSYAAGLIKGIRKRLDEAAMIDMPAQIFVHLGEKMNGLEICEPDDLLRLVNYPNNLAINLAQARDDVLIVSKALQQSQIMSLNDASIRKHFARDMSNLLQAAESKIAQSTIECKNAIQRRTTEL